MNWNLVIPLLAILGIKLIGTTLFLQYFSQVFYTSTLKENSSSTQKEPKDCPRGWESFGGECYSFPTLRQTWENSRKECIRQSADLAIVNNEEELTFLKSLTESENYFVGLTRNNRDRIWRWINNANLDPRIFDVSQSNFDCGVVGINFTGSVPCMVSHRSICETKT